MAEIGLTVARERIYQGCIGFGEDHRSPLARTELIKWINEGLVKYVVLELPKTLMPFKPIWPLRPDWSYSNWAEGKSFESLAKLKHMVENSIRNKDNPVSFSMILDAVVKNKIDIYMWDFDDEIEAVLRKEKKRGRSKIYMEKMKSVENDFNLKLVTVNYTEKIVDVVSGREVVDTSSSYRNPDIVRDFKSKFTSIASARHTVILYGAAHFFEFPSFKNFGLDLDWVDFSKGMPPLPENIPTPIFQNSALVEMTDDRDAMLQR
jgi:hypothetical protein